MVNLPTDLREKNQGTLPVNLLRKFVKKKISGDLLGNLPLSGNL